jgi:anaerobic selenocysteine-containing dehydrogenase
MDQAFPIPFAQYTSPVVEPLGERRPLWRVMAELAERMGIAIPAIEHIDDDEELVRSVTKRSRLPFDVLRAAPSGVVVDDAPRSNWLIPDRVPKGRLDLAPEPFVGELRDWLAANQAASGDEQTSDGRLRLICRRLPHQMNSDLQEVPSQQRRPFPTLLMNVSDAAHRGLVDGDTVMVSTANGCTEATVEVTDRIRPGVVSLPHSWRSPAVNALTSTEDLDPLTGMPRFTSISVSVSRTPDASATVAATA